MEYLIVILLILLSGIFSGLTLGLFSINLTAIERKIKLGDRRAIKIYPVRKNGNLLLCTLLLGNVSVNAAIAIFLETIAGGVIAGFIATALIVVFGEILPQGAFARYALDVSARLIWIVKIFRFILFPVAWPLARLLDLLLGKEMPTIWSKNEIKEIIKHHEDSSASVIDADEERIVLGALSFSDKKAAEIMTPRRSTLLLDARSKLTKTLITKIRDSGFSRIPVYKGDPNNVIGILYTKELVGRELGYRNIQSFVRKSILETGADTSLDKLLRVFARKRAHLAVVRDRFQTLLGVVTLEDVIEEIIRIEIRDETDKS